MHTVGGTEILRHYFDDCEDVLIFSLAVQKHVCKSYRVPHRCVHIIWDEPEAALLDGSGLSDIRYRLQGTVTFQALTEDSCPMLIVPDCDGLWECLVCGDPCVDAECDEGDNNCSVCGICSLCPFCHVHVGRGSWRCFYCLTKLQVEQLSLSPGPVDELHSLSLLGGATMIRPRHLRDFHLRLRGVAKHVFHARTDDYMHPQRLEPNVLGYNIWFYTCVYARTTCSNQCMWSGGFRRCSGRYPRRQGCLQFCAGRDAPCRHLEY